MGASVISRCALLCLAMAGSALAQSDFTLSYVLPTNQNVVPLQSGGVIPFPPTPINSVTVVQLNITNIGGSAGKVNNISETGSAFALTGLPLLPATVGAGTSLQVQIRYQPVTFGNDTGQITITYEGGKVDSVGLQGSVSSPKFVYQLLAGGPPTTLTPGGVVSLPATNVGDNISVAIQVQNTGNGNGIINSISVTGLDYQLSELPLLPENLAPNASFAITITFTPTQPGDRKGQLFIGTDSFSLVGRGLGPKLVFSFVAAGITTPLGTNGSVVFSPVMISQTGQVTFVVQNTGTLAATVFNIGIVEANSPFSLSGLPGLPVQLDPGGQSSFQIAFAPITTGFSNGTLRLDSTTVSLIGSGTPPPPLPAYSLQGPSGNVAGMTQAAVSLKLAGPYPVAIAGTLTLTASGDLPSDPGAQFSVGGRAAPFVIPANSTDAQFAGQGPQIQVQTGTVAGTITLTPSFATQAGGVNLTPNTPASLQFTVPPAAPTLISALVGNEGTSSFAVTVIGFSTTRSLTSLTVQFTSASGFSVTSTPINIDLHQAASVWFQSTASVAFGGQFAVTVPFTLRGTVSATQTLLQSLSSVAVTASNDTGTSNTLQANF